MLSLLRCSTDEARLTPDEGPALLSRPVASMCRLATGRSALFHLTTRLPAGHARAVLMPCYVPEGVIQPFTAAGFERVFYRLRADLTPSVEDVERQLSAIGSGAVFMRIHYFGFPTIDARLDDVLARHACIVVDDLAHAPFAVQPDGARLVDHGQIALFSLNKFLPVADGAILVSRRHDIDVALPETKLPELPREALEAYQAHLRSGSELFATTDPQLARAALRRLGEEYETYYACINSDLTPHRQSARSRDVEARFPFGDLVSARARNTAIVYSGLRNELFSLVHPTLPAGLVPFGIPARVPAGRRHGICSRLLERGVLLSTLQDKWDFVPRDRRDEFPVESAFLDDHVLIPVSETIAESAMRAAVATLNDIEVSD